MTETEKTDRDRVKLRLKARLAEYRDKALERRLLERELKDLEAQAGSLGSPNMDGMPRGSNTSDPTAREAVGSVTLQTLYRDRLALIITEQTEVEQLIECLPIRERILMRLRYIKGRGWDEICELMAYSWTHVHRIHSSALNKLTDREMEEIYGED